MENHHRPTAMAFHMHFVHQLWRMHSPTSTSEEAILQRPPVKRTEASCVPQRCLSSLSGPHRCLPQPVTVRSSVMWEEFRKKFKEENPENKLEDETVQCFASLIWVLRFCFSDYVFVALKDAAGGNNEDDCDKSKSDVNKEKEDNEECDSYALGLMFVECFAIVVVYSMCYDKYLRKCLQKAAETVGHSFWGRPPDKTASYNSQPQDTKFFCDGGDYDSTYGNFFLNWHSQFLIDHGDRVLTITHLAFESTPIPIKVFIGGAKLLAMQLN
ncbi:hypothetical protein E3N88_38468 [Mikania micrantha]|uniref:Beta-amylase n=1 Tax=Mikania micrantha TaxID=192012 RepID=A0A5N6LU40_9ASTR|nr:hypothetical protein E3N88_38468 [Mikania micrantha]